VNTANLFNNTSDKVFGPPERVKTNEPGRRMVPRVLVVTSLVLVALLSVILFSVVSLINKAPEWWRAVDVSSLQTKDLAEQVEKAVVSTVHRHRPLDEPWTVAVTVQQANAWLNVKLPQWISNRSAQWPAQIEELQMHFTGEDTLALGARIQGHDSSRVVVATVRPSVEQDGSLWLRMDAAQAGRLDLPRNWTVEQLRDWIPQEVSERIPTDQLLDALAAMAPMFEEPVLKLDDGRRVRLLAIRPENGRLLLTCVTEPHAVIVKMPESDD
jgi:uncharacterized protein YpmS